MTYTQEVKINGTDVSTYVINWKVYKNKSDIEQNRVTVQLRSDVFSVATVDVGKSLTVSKGDDTASNRLFTGIVEKYDFISGVVTVIGRDNFYNLKYKLVTKSYDINIDTEVGVISAIASDLISNASYGNLTANVVNSGLVYILNKFICNDDNIRERITTLSKILNWQAYWDDANSQVNFQPEGYTDYSTVLDVGGYVQNIPKWEIDITNMRNKYKVKGAVRRDWKVETFTGDAAETDFTLTKTPKDTEVYVTATLKIRGVSDSTGTYDYTVDEDRKLIQFTVASTPPAAADNIEVNYSHDIPMPVIARNQESINDYGLKEDAKYFDDIRTIADAEVRVRNIIAKIGVPFNRTTLHTVGLYDLKVGLKVHVVDSQQNQDLWLTIQNITYQFPEGYDIVKVGDEDFRLRDFISNISTRIRELEKKELSNQDILTNIFELNRNIPLEKRYMYLTSLDTTPDGIWGRGFGNGTTDSLNWGASGAVWQSTHVNSVVIKKVVQGNNTYKEFFYDTDFDGSGAATWDTTNRWLSFTSGQTRTTDSVAIGTAYSYFTLTLAEVTGTITTQISPDGGSTWQTVSTLGLRTAFDTSSSTGVQLKFTEAGAITAKINNTYKADGSYDQPGIKLVLEE